MLADGAKRGAAGRIVKIPGAFLFFIGRLIPHRSFFAELVRRPLQLVAARRLVCFWRRRGIAKAFSSVSWYTLSEYSQGGIPNSFLLPSALGCSANSILCRIFGTIPFFRIGHRSKSNW